MADRIERAKQAFIHRDFDLAIAEYTRAARELPDAQAFVAYSNRGAALMNTGKVKDAIKCFRKALELNSEHYESMHNMGVAFAAMKQYDKALECFEKTLEYAPYFYASYCGKSEALACLGRFDEAVDAAKDGIQEDPNEPIAHADLGFAYLKLGRFEEAVKAYERAHVLKDRSAETARLHAVALSEHALTCERNNDLATAVEMLLKSIQKHETPLALHNLGIIYVRLAQPSKAKTAFGKALKLDPNYFATNAALGVLHAQERLNDLALPFLIKARELNPNHVENLYNLGLVYMKEGNMDDAQSTFVSLLKIDTSHQDAKLALQLIKSVQLGASVGAGASGLDVSSPAPLPPRASSVRPGTKSRTPRGTGAAETPTYHHAPRGSSSTRRDRSAPPANRKRRGTSKPHRIKQLHSVEALRANPVPEGVDPSQRELYLHDNEFRELFGMSKEEFLELPYWRQTLEKKRNKLF